MAALAHRTRLTERAGAKIIELRVPLHNLFVRAALAPSFGRYIQCHSTFLPLSVPRSSSAPAIVFAFIHIIHAHFQLTTALS